MPATTRMDLLCDVYENFNKSHSLNLGSADEHLFDEDLTETQRQWIRRFNSTWERAALRAGWLAP